MKYLNKLVLFFILICNFQLVNAQFTINGEFRTKTMFLDGYKQLLNKSQHPNGIVVQRSRLLFDYKKENMTFAFSIQDIRNWGQDAISANNNNLGVFEAWAKYNFTDKFSVKMGRQQIKYDDERLFTATNWTDQGVAHDIAVFQYDNKGKYIKADMGLGMNNAGFTNYLTDYTVKNYKYLAYLWLNKAFINNKMDVSLMSVVDVNQKPLDANKLNSRFTIGPNFGFKTGNFKIGGIFYYQGGNIADGKTLNANFYAAKISYKIAKILELSLAYDHYSGTDYKDTSLAKTRSNTFDKLYGSGHAYLGYMDYFSGNASDFTKGAGINDFYVRANIEFKEKHTIEASYHFYNLDKGYIPNANKESMLINKYLGSEIDLIYTYKFNKQANLSLGYCTMLPSESMEYISNIKANEHKYSQFAYLMISFKPNFYTSKD